MEIHPQSKENTQFYIYEPEIEEAARRLKSLKSKQLKYPFLRFGSQRMRLKVLRF